MDISALLADGGDVMPRRSSSNAHSVTAPSPATSNAKLPSPTLSAPQPATARPKAKRGRHDPKPIWAVREHEVVENGPPRQPQQRLETRPPPPHQQSHPPVAMARPQPPPASRTNGAPPAGGPAPLRGFERPITDDDHVYNDVTRRVCDFLWNNVITNQPLRHAVHTSPGTEIEIEARWGHIIDSGTGFRLEGVHETECVVRQESTLRHRFESTMSLEQHKQMNLFLNEHVKEAAQSNGRRERVDYRHTKEVDMLYELDQNGFNMMPDAIKHIVAQEKKKQRVRVTRDLQTGKILRKIIKLRIGNLEISSPQTEWDYRIGINLEIHYPGPVEELEPIVEKGHTVESIKRKKDRVSYSYLGVYQIDLTQVHQGHTKNHELELELSGARILAEGDKIQNDQPSAFESLVAGLMNNLRILSREVTPPK